jgi:hypothetical protein
MLEPLAQRRRPLDADASAAGQVGSPSTDEPTEPAAVPVVRRPPSRRATPAEMAEMRADYLKGEAERRAKGYRYVCPLCSHVHVPGAAHVDAA